MNAHMEVRLISRRGKEEDGVIERLWKRCGGRLRLTCEGNRSGGDERAHSNEARVLQVSTLFRVKELSFIGIPYRLTVANFGKMKDATNQFDRSELRILAKMMVIRTVLKDQKASAANPEFVKGMTDK